MFTNADIANVAYAYGTLIGMWAFSIGPVRPTGGKPEKPNRYHTKISKKHNVQLMIY